MRWVVIRNYTRDLIIILTQYLKNVFSIREALPWRLCFIFYYKKEGPSLSLIVVIIISFVVMIYQYLTQSIMLPI